MRILVYDGDALIAEYDTSGGMPHRYIHGNDQGADDPLIWYDNYAGGWRRPLLTDHQGSIVEVADMYGNPLYTNSYDPWGIPGAANAGRFGYTGQAWVPELGLWYYKARFYSPTLGRFMQTDPVGYKDQINLYAYVGNDPVNRTDPTGQQQIQERADGRRIVYVLPAKIEARINRTHGPNAPNTKDHFRTNPTTRDLTRYASNAVRDAERTGRVNNEGPVRGTSYDGVAEKFWGSDNKLKSAANLGLGVGSEGQTEVRVVVHDLADVGDPVVVAQATAQAAAAAAVADAMTGNRSTSPLEIRVITNIYPIKSDP
jgi:RHS repeat-associated protein